MNGRIEMQNKTKKYLLDPEIIFQFSQLELLCGSLTWRSDLTIGCEMLDSEIWEDMKQVYESIKPHIEKIDELLKAKEENNGVAENN